MDKELFESDLLYHYTTIEKAIEFILQDKKLKFSSLESVNDPWEYKRIYKFKIKHDFEKLLKRQKIKTVTGNIFDEISKDAYTNKIINELMQSVSEKISKTKIACFCIKAIDKEGYEKSRMWSQYANDHYGICISFSKSKFIEICNKEYSMPIIHDNVRYINFKKENAIEINFESFRKELKNLHQEAIDKYSDDVLKQIVFTKDSDYKTENEYRIMILDEKDLFIPIENIIKEITLGDRFKCCYMINFKEYCKELNIPLYEIKWEFGIPIRNKLLT